MVHARVILIVGLTFLAYSQATADESFLACTQNSLPQLDDGVSSADVVARGVVEECSKFLESAQCSPECLLRAKQIVTDEIIPNVLKYRSSKRAADDEQKGCAAAALALIQAVSQSKDQPPNGETTTSLILKIEKWNAGGCKGDAFSGADH